MREGVKGHSRWRLMVGACFGGKTADHPPTKRMAGSSKMAAAGGSVFWGGRPLGDMGKSRAQQQQLDDIKKRVE